MQLGRGNAKMKLKGVQLKEKCSLHTALSCLPGNWLNGSIPVKSAMATLLQSKGKSTGALINAMDADLFRRRECGIIFGV